MRKIILAILLITACVNPREKNFLESLEQQRDTIFQLRDTIKQLREIIEFQYETIEQQRETIDYFNELTEQKEQSGESCEEVKKQRYYICTGSEAKKYHLTRYCSGLNACSAEIKAISFDELTRSTRTPCNICFGY